MTFFTQLGLLLWKNWLLQKRKYIITIAEVLIPVAFACLILMIRSLVNVTEESTPTDYPIYKTLSNQGSSGFSGAIFPLNMSLGYYPETTETTAVMDIAKARFDIYTTSTRNASTTFDIMGFPDEDSAVSYFKSNSDNMQQIIAFNVSSGQSLPANLHFDVRPITGDTRWRTKQTFPFIQDAKPRSTDSPPYKKVGVIFMQRLIAEAVTRYWFIQNGKPQDDVQMDVSTQQFSYPPYIDDPIIQVLQQTLPLLLVLSFILSVIVNTKNLVEEKEKKLKESMKLMGLRSSVHWVSWAITFLVYLVPAVAVYAMLCGLNIVTSKGPVLQNTDVSLFFVFLLVYSCCIISFCFMISTFVQKANVAAALSGILFFAFYFPYYFIQPSYEDIGRNQKMASGLLFNCGMALGANIIGLYEGTGEGAKWSNFHEPATPDDNITMLDVIIILIVDCVWMLAITWYLDNVRPGEFGVPKPFYFCFTKTYWCGGRGRSNSVYETEKRDTKSFEREPEGLKAGIQIKNLRKKFGNKTAVAGTSLNMFEGEICVLLGHNGAGKTTTMSMLTGFLPPTSGTAVVNGYDITEDIASVRGSLGLCPQHNILFDTMTVNEHLEFFARLKGSTGSGVAKDVVDTAKEIGLELKQHAPSSSLSGGMKRKLSVGIALIGGSKVVILDEPTSGMDPGARRQTWNVLQKAREGRTLVLSTHYMDEADLLGDRIAIMAQGVIKCCGSSMFLKKLYGAGYHMVVVKEESCDVNKLTDFVQSIIPTAELETVINREVTYLLPENQVANFPTLFRGMDKASDAMGVTSFGTSATTMEEVFLKVGDHAYDADEDANSDNSGVNAYENMTFKEDNPGKKTQSRKQTAAVVGAHNRVDAINETNKDVDIMSFNKGYTKKTGFQLEMSRIYGLFVKKAIHTWRNKSITITQLLLPVIFTILGLWADGFRPTGTDDPSLKFTIDAFKDPIIPYAVPINYSPTANFGDLYKAPFPAGYMFDVDLNTYSTYSNGTLAKAAQVGTTRFKKSMVIGMQLLTPDPQAGSQISAIAMYGGAPYHAHPIAMNYLLNTYVQLLTNNSMSISTGVFPLPRDNSASGQFNALLGLSAGFSVSFFISFGMAFLTTFFIHFLIKERESGSKHLQTVSGVGPLAYWIPTLLWDFINYILPSLLLLVVFAAFDKQAYLADGRFLVTILLLVVYGWAVLPFMYLLQFGFKSPPTGVVLVIMLNIVSGLITTITVFILQIPGLGTEDVAKTLNWVFMTLFPNYNMAQAFSNMYTNYLNADYCTTSLENEQICKLSCLGLIPDFDFCFKYFDNYMEWDTPGIGSYLVFMAWQGAVFMALVMLIEYHVFQRLWYLIGGSPSDELTPGTEEQRTEASEDSDVAAERTRINGSPASVSGEDSLVLANLFKQYGTFTAVDHICVGVPQQECFGLLGQNGAGKTTTFKMLTGDVMVTGGNAFLKGFDVRNNIKQVQANMGYCPQFDALIDQMTGRETLTMYARLRGVPEGSIKVVVDTLIDILMLRPHADKLSGDYSGGNKRKLSTAIALVGDPPFIMLDEPSSGMDPKARRQLWNVLSQVRASGRTLVLTSHSMEECDALCTRIAIMVNGQFKCLGSPQHLKNKFGQGYTLIVQMGHSPEDGVTAPNEPVTNFIMENFPGAKVFDAHQGYIHFQVPSNTTSLADVFELMESTKLNLQVEDYSVHQTTLEQVFLTFTRSQITPPEKSKKGLCAPSLLCLVCPLYYFVCSSRD